VIELHPAHDLPGVEAEASPPAWLTSDPVWRASAGAILARVREHGLALRRTRPAETGVGAFYAERARRGAPLVVTADALFAIAHLALTSTLADVEERVMRVDLSTLLRRLDVRLGAEATRAKPDLLEGYRVARTTISVALALFDPGYVVPVDIAPRVAEEVSLVRAHAGVARSPLFELPLDYGSFSPRGPIATATDPRAAAFLAAQWTGAAPFSFEGEGRGAAIDVGMARSQARAALLLARLLVQDGDAPAAAAAERMARLDRFSLGDSDDLSPLDAARLARRSGIDLGGGSDIGSTTKVDRFRHEASGIAATPAPPRPDGAGTLPWTSLRSMRLVPLRAPSDNRAPRESHDSRDAGLDRALASLLADPPRDARVRHASVYASMLEAMATWLRPSAAAPSPPSARDAEGRRKLRTALSAWTLLRHDAIAFAHEGPRALRLELDPHGSRARVFVEPHPEAIASLLGAIEQLHHGLGELGALKDDSPSSAVLAETARLLALALEASVRAANGDPATAGLDAQLAQMPARMAALEGAVQPALLPVVIDVHVDMTSGRVLEEGTGPVEEVFLWMKSPDAREPVLAVGVAIPHVEIVESGWARSSDLEWRARISAGRVAELDASEPETVPPDGSDP
jgi:hypothetical protein